MVEPSEGIGAAGAWPEAPRPGFAILPWGTRVYVEPRYGSRSSRLRRPVEVAPPWPVEGSVVRVLGGRDGFVEIAPLLENTQGHCAEMLTADGYDVRLYVSPWAFASVLTESFEAHHEDGSSMRLQPGAIVRPIADDPQERWAISAAGLQLRAALTPEVVGTSYAETQPETMPGNRQWVMGPGHSMQYDGGWALEWSPRRDIAIESVLPAGERYRVEVVSHCARVTAWADRPPEAAREEFRHFDFGLGAESVHLPTEGPIDVTALLGVSNEPARLEDVFVPEQGAVFDDLLADEVFMDGEVMGELLRAEPPREQIFETGAPIYLGTTGPRAGRLTHLRSFGEDHWIAGERVCFRTFFGGQFTPVVGVCFDVAESRRRTPQTDPDDFGRGTVEPVRLKVGPGLDEALVARALRSYRHQLRHCFNEVQPIRGDGSGRLEMTLDTARDGTVSHVRLRSRWLGPVSTCATSAAESWTMPPTRDGAPGRITFAVDLVPR